MDERSCAALRKDGTVCRARLLPGTALCWSHDPSQAEAAREARSEGARKANARRRLRRYPDPAGGQDAQTSDAKAALQEAAAARALHADPPRATGSLSAQPQHTPWPGPAL
jgi:hypothetical protein